MAGNPVDILFHTIKQGGLRRERPSRGHSGNEKKPPCGANRFAVLRVGMDFRIKCEGCGHEMLVPRLKIERHIKRIHRQDDTL